MAERQPNSKHTIKRMMKKMKNNPKKNEKREIKKGLLKRIGPAKGGYWKVMIKKS